MSTTTPSLRDEIKRCNNDLDCILWRRLGVSAGSVSIDIRDDGTTPSNPNVKIGEVDTSANTTTETNRAAEGEFESLSAESATLGPTTLTGTFDADQNDIVDGASTVYDATTDEVTADVNNASVNTDELSGGVTGGVSLTKIAGTNLSISGGTLNASESNYTNVASGQATLSSGIATVNTGISATDATFMLSLGIDDPNADAKVAGRLFWDDSAGTYKIEVVEDGTNIGNPTVNYDILRVR